MSQTRDYFTNVSETIKPSDYRKIMKFILQGNIKQASKVFQNTDLEFDEVGLSMVDLSPAQKKILECLIKMPMNANEVSSLTGLKPHTVRSQVSLLKDKEIGAQCYKIFRKGSRYALYPKLVIPKSELLFTTSVNQENDS